MTYAKLGLAIAAGSLAVGILQYVDGGSRAVEAKGSQPMAANISATEPAKASQQSSQVTRPETVDGSGTAVKAALFPPSGPAQEKPQIASPSPTDDQKNTRKIRIINNKIGAGGVVSGINEVGGGISIKK